MDCNTARQLIDFARPCASELDAEETGALQEHFAECPLCRSVADTEWQIDDHIGRAMRAVPIPAQLRQRLLCWLHRERKTWYSRWVGAPTAAAAGILLAFGIGAGIWERLHPAPNEDVVVILPSGLPRENVEQQFREIHGIRVVAPPQFDYEYVLPIRLGEFQGKQVPELRFERGEHLVAIVYILSDEQFKLDLNPEKREGYSVTLLRHPNNPHVAYVVYFTGGQLERFLANQGQHAV